jgi:hypothetical protein
VESFGTTIPKVVLQGLDPTKSYKVKWDFDKSKGKWFVGLERELSYSKLSIGRDTIQIKSMKGRAQ